MKYLLNLRKSNNYAFFCPQSRMHLTISNPVGFADRVTPAIERALKAETIIDITEGKEQKTVEKKSEEAPTPIQEESTESVEVEAPVEETEAEVPVEEEKKTAKKGRKSTK